jgi:hypothetical protein
MIKKTTDYTLFTLRPDNRNGINQSHVKRLAESIKQRNLLEYRPISVNASHEIIDGQHRFLAAKQLGVEIYYEINQDLVAEDIIILNNSKSWGIGDYMNYYCKNGYDHYIKLKNFSVSNGLSLKVALTLLVGQSKKKAKDFREGEFKFIGGEYEKHMDDCWQTIDLIKRLNGYSYYTSTCRFWQSLIKLITSAGFDKEKWFRNLEKMSEQFGPRATADDYLKLLQRVYNWRNENKIQLLEDI